MQQRGRPAVRVGWRFVRRESINTGGRCGADHLLRGTIGVSLLEDVARPRVLAAHELFELTQVCHGNHETEQVV